MTVTTTLSLTVSNKAKHIILSTRCNIYIVYTSVFDVCALCIVVTGCNGSRIPLHAWIDGCLCYLLTNQCLTRIVRWDDAGISGGRGVWKIGNLGRKCTISEERFVLEL